MRLLRIEGVNHAHCIDDTEDLSTRRGGGLMLLDAITHIESGLGDRVRRISAGASTGLFEVLGDGAEVLKTVRARLTDTPYTYGSFMVDLVEDENFATAETAAIAANRWRQMRSLSFSGMGLGVSHLGACEVDEKRPAVAPTKLKGETQALGASVQARREYGLTAKRRFYARTLDEHYADFKFCNEFEEIAGNPKSTLRTPSLAGKLAVFYADGNAFGKIANAAAKQGPDALRAWDAYLRGQRKAFLAALLDHAAAHDHWQTADDKLRLEILLWGGDELKIVVPGWCGLELADFFLEHTRGMRYPDNAHDPAAQPLTHACGLVFCHYKAPISRISRLATVLADQGKASHARANSLNWLLLESFDHTGGGLDDYLRRRFAGRLGWADLTLDEKTLPVIARDFPCLQDRLPHSALIRVAQAMAAGQAFDEGQREQPLIRRARRQIAEAGGKDFKDLWSRLHPQGATWNDDLAHPDDLGTWIKLAELWEYGAQILDKDNKSGDPA